MFILVRKNASSNFPPCPHKHIHTHTHMQFSAFPRLLPDCILQSSKSLCTCSFSCYSPTGVDTGRELSLFHPHLQCVLNATSIAYGLNFPMLKWSTNLIKGLIKKKLGCLPLQIWVLEALSFISLLAHIFSPNDPIDPSVVLCWVNENVNSHQRGVGRCGHPLRLGWGRGEGGAREQGWLGGSAD